MEELKPNLRVPFIVNVIGPNAIARYKESLETAERLLRQGFISPAYVWAMRSAEILYKELVLFPLFFEDTGNIDASWKKARDEILDGNWKRSVEMAIERYGNEHGSARTEAGEDAMQVWLRYGVELRHRIVHGETDASSDETESTIEWVKTLHTFTALRVMTADLGPFPGALQKVIDQAADEYERAKKVYASDKD